MLSHKMDFNCCANRDGFRIDSHIYNKMTDPVLLLFNIVPTFGGEYFCKSGELSVIFQYFTKLKLMISYFYVATHVSAKFSSNYIRERS